MMFEGTIGNLFKMFGAIIVLAFFFNAGRDSKKQIRDEDKDDKVQDQKED